MEPITHSTNPCTCQAPYARQPFNASETQLAAVSSSQSLDLDIVTQEGDKVTLSIDAKMSALYASHGHVDADDGGMLVQWDEFGAGQLEREISLSVEGDLNTRERREIRKVIKTINRMMHNFVHGKLKPMMAQADKLEGLQTIDALDVNMSYERQVVVARQHQMATGYDRQGAIKDVAADKAHALEAAPSRGLLDVESTNVAKAMAGEAASARAPLANVLEAVNRLFRVYRDMVQQWNSLGGNVMDHARDVFEAAMGVADDAMDADVDEASEVDD